MEIKESLDPCYNLQLCKIVVKKVFRQASQLLKNICLAVEQRGTVA